MRRAGAIAVLGLTGLLAPAGVAAQSDEGLDGRVLDPDRKPVHGARVCYMIGEAEGVCADTDEQGRFDLPASHLTTYRVEASGFQSRTLNVAGHKGPIVLQRAASMWVRVRDAESGRTVPASEVFLIMPDGQREGPLPANDKGVKIRTLLPGKYGIVARADGYTQSAAVTVTLTAGADRWVDVEMKPAGKPK